MEEAKRSSSSVASSDSQADQPVADVCMSPQALSPEVSAFHELFVRGATDARCCIMVEKLLCMENSQSSTVGLLFLILM